MTQGLADPLYDYFTPGLPGGESNVYTGVVDTGFQNAFAVNHDINTHYGIPVIGYLDIFTPLLGTNELEIGATIGSIFSSLIDAVSQAWDWLTSGFKSDYVSYSDTGEYSDPSGYYDSGGDNAFDDFSGYEESGGGGGGGDGGEELEEAF